MSQDPAAHAGAAPGKRVLVVDDNADWADSLVMLPRLDGIDARAALSAGPRWSCAARPRSLALGGG